MQSSPMPRTLSFVLRVVLAVTCLLPLTGPRAFAAVSVPVSSDRGSIPNRPVEEEDENERTDTELRDIELRIERRHDLHSSSSNRLSLPLTLRFGQNRSLHPAAILDHFRNGLGTPYRC